MNEQTRNVLRKAKELVVANWGQGSGAMGPTDGHCVLTALGTASAGQFGQPLWAEHLRDATASVKDILEAPDGAGCSSIAGWNDTPGRTQAEVVALFDQALAGDMPARESEAVEGYERVGAVS